MNNYDWLDKIIEFKNTCKEGSIMTAAQARILRSVLYDYEIVRKPLKDILRTKDTIEQEIVNKNNESITIDRIAAQAIIDLLTNKLK